MNRDHIRQGEWGRTARISDVWGIRNRYYISGTAAWVTPPAPSPSDNMFLTGFPSVPPGLVTISQSVCLQTDNQPLISTQCHGCSLPSSSRCRRRPRYVKKRIVWKENWQFSSLYTVFLTCSSGISNPCGTRGWRCFLCLVSRIWYSLLQLLWKSSACVWTCCAYGG